MRLRDLWIATGACSAFLIAATTPCFAEEPAIEDAELDVAPDDALPPSSARTNLLLVGGVATVGFYGVAAGTSYLWPSSPVSDDLLIPVVGPYSAVFGAGCGDGERGCGTFVAIIRTTFATISAIGQTGGVLLLGEALFMSTEGSDSRTPVRGTSAQSQQSEIPATWYAAPIADDGNFGFVLGGSF